MKNKILDFPNRVVLELTPLCNLSCEMCPRHIIDKQKGYMSQELWKKCIDEISLTNKEAKVLPFWRGESLLHKKFNEFSLYALNKGLKLHISTNGHFLNDSNSKILSRYEFITFSCHTLEGFEKAINFTKNHKNDENTIQISFVDCEKEMIPLLDKILEDSNLKGFDGVRLYIEHSKDGVFGSIGADGGSQIERFFCPKLEHTLVVSHDGYISRCNHIWEPEKYNLTKTSIREAWQSLEMKTIRENYPDKLCMPCDQWSGRTQGKFWEKEDGNMIEVNR